LQDHAAWLAVQARGGGGLRLQFGKHDIPAYWAFAQRYNLCDNYFTDVASQSEPSHLRLIAAGARMSFDFTAPPRLAVRSVVPK
jgi:phospholipase C